MSGNFEENAPKYARAGLHVFPLLPASKTPLKDSHAYLDATTDLAKIAEWSRQYPDYNIGWCPGFSNKIVLDFDTKSFDDPNVRCRPNGLNTLEDLLVAIPEMEAAWIIETATGGFHYIFSTPPDLQFNGKDQAIAPRMDFKFKKGFAVLPNSSHGEGGTYRWIRGKQHIDIPPMLPQQIIQMILDAQTKERDFDHINPSDTSPIPPGERHDTFVRYAGSLKNKGLTEEGMLAELRAVNRLRCPDHDDRDLINIVKSAREWSAGRALLDEVMYGTKPLYTGFSPPGSTGNKSLKITWYDAVTPKAKEWLMPGYIPTAGLTLWGGIQGSSKSFAIQGIASLLSRGLPLPGTTFTEPIRSLLFTTEDDQESEIPWRLDKCGADKSKVGTIFLGDDEFKSSDTSPLEETLKKFPDVRLIVLDPATAFVGNIDDNNEMQVRGALQPLNALAQQYKIAVILIKHMTKDESKSMLNRFSGATAWTALPRSVILSGQDNQKVQEPFHKYCGMMEVKYRMWPPLRYEIDQGVFRFTGEDRELDEDHLLPKPPDRNKK